MVHIYRSKWLYAVAGSGVVLGLLNYFQTEKRTVKNAWTTSYVPSVKWDSNWDNREFSSLVNSNKEQSPSEENLLNKATKKTRRPRRHTFLIRHGQYNLNGKTDADRYLTGIGQQQAQLVGQRLKDLKLNYSRILRSTMTRAVETSDIIHKVFPDLPVESCDLLREGAPIPPEPSLPTWNILDEQYLKDGSRIEAAFKKYFHRADDNQTTDSYDIMVCHANVIRYFVCRLLQFPPEAWLRFQLHHCSITWVTVYANADVVVYTVGDSGFLPEHLLTA